MGDPFHKETEQGPQVDEDQFNKVNTLIKCAQKYIVIVFLFFVSCFIFYSRKLFSKTFPKITNVSVTLLLAYFNDIILGQCRCWDTSRVGLGRGPR